MRASILLVCTILCASLSAFAESSFKVIAVRGSVSSSRGSTLVIGTTLALSDKITLGSGGYVGLVHSNGRTLEIRKSGAYAMRDLDKAATKKSGSVNSKFASYVVNELTQTKDPIAFQDKHRANMRVTGAVERAAGDEVSALDTVANAVGGFGEAQRLAVVAYNSVSSGSMIMVVMPRSTRLTSDTVRFSWHRSPTRMEYTLRLYDRASKPVFERTVNDTSVVLDLRQCGVVPGQLQYWRVESASDPGLHSEEYGLYRLTGAELFATESVLTEVRLDVVDPEASVSKLILAAACEDQGLIYDAYCLFDSVIKEEPSVKNYKRMFAEFLQRQGLHAEAYEVYQ